VGSSHRFSFLEMRCIVALYIHPGRIGRCPESVPDYSSRELEGSNTYPWPCRLRI
jgi:hypothetical protein